MNNAMYFDGLTAAMTGYIRQRARQQHVSLRALSDATGISYRTLQRRMSSHGWGLNETAAIGRVLGFTNTELAQAAEQAVAGGQQ